MQIITVALTAEQKWIKNRGEIMKKYIKAVKTSEYGWDIESDVDSIQELAAFACILLLKIADKVDEESRLELKRAIQDSVVNGIN